MLVERAGGALTVTVGVPVQIDGMSKPLNPLFGQTVSREPRLLI